MKIQRHVRVFLWLSYHCRAEKESQAPPCVQMNFSAFCCLVRHISRPSVKQIRRKRADREKGALKGPAFGGSIIARQYSRW